MKQSTLYLTCIAVVVFMLAGLVVSLSDIGVIKISPPKPPDVPTSAPLSNNYLSYAAYDESPSSNSTEFVLVRLMSYSIGGGPFHPPKTISLISVAFLDLDIDADHGDPTPRKLYEDTIQMPYISAINIQVSKMVVSGDLAALIFANLSDPARLCARIYQKAGYGGWHVFKTVQLSQRGSKWAYNTLYFLSTGTNTPFGVYPTLFDETLSMYLPQKGGGYIYTWNHITRDSSCSIMDPEVCDEVVGQYYAKKSIMGSDSKVSKLSSDLICPAKDISFVDLSCRAPMRAAGIWSASTHEATTYATRLFTAAAIDEFNKTIDAKFDACADSTGHLTLTKLSWAFGFGDDGTSTNNCTIIDVKELFSKIQQLSNDQTIQAIDLPDDLKRANPVNSVSVLDLLLSMDADGDGLFSKSEVRDGLFSKYVFYHSIGQSYPYGPSQKFKEFLLEPMISNGQMMLINRIPETQTANSIDTIISMLRTEHSTGNVELRYSSCKFGLPTIGENSTDFIDKWRRHKSNPIASSFQGGRGVSVAMIGLQSEYGAPTTIGMLIEGYPQTLKAAIQNYYPTCPHQLVTIPLTFEIGTFCLGGEGSIVTSHEFQLIICSYSNDGTGTAAVILRCGPGMYQSGLRCQPCQPGYFQYKDRGDCVQCPKGFFSSTIGASTSTACQRCPTGSYGKYEGQKTVAACTKCPKGTYSSSPGAFIFSACHICPAGYYSLEGDSGCRKCPATSHCSFFSPSETGWPPLLVSPNIISPQPSSSNQVDAIGRTITVAVAFVVGGLVIIGISFLPGAFIGVKSKDFLNKLFKKLGSAAAGLFSINSGAGEPNRMQNSAHTHTHAHGKDRVLLSLSLVFFAIIFASLSFNLSILLDANVVVEPLPLQYFGSSQVADMFPINDIQLNNREITVGLRGWFGECSGTVVAGYGKGGGTTLSTAFKQTSYGCEVQISRSFNASSTAIQSEEEYRVVFPIDTISTGVFVQLRSGVGGKSVNQLSELILPGDKQSIFAGGKQTSGSGTVFHASVAAALYVDDNVWESLKQSISQPISISGKTIMQRIIDGGLFIAKNDVTLDQVVSVNESGYFPASSSSSSSNDGLLVTVRISQSPYFHVILQKQKLSVTTFLLTVISQIGGALSFVKLFSILSGKSNDGDNKKSKPRLDHQLGSMDVGLTLARMDDDKEKPLIVHTR